MIQRHPASRRMSRSTRFGHARSKTTGLGRFELCLNVRDLPRSLEFYGKLGFEGIGGNLQQGGAILVPGNLIYLRR